MSSRFVEIDKIRTRGLVLGAKVRGKANKSIQIG